MSPLHHMPIFRNSNCLSLLCSIDHRCSHHVYLSTCTLTLCYISILHANVCVYIYTHTQLPSSRSLLILGFWFQWEDHTFLCSKFEHFLLDSNLACKILKSHDTYKTNWTCVCSFSSQHQQPIEKERETISNGCWILPKWWLLKE